jgi:hypothetical protein
VTAKIRRSGRPERVDDYSGVRGELVKLLRAAGIKSAFGAGHGCRQAVGRYCGVLRTSPGFPRTPSIGSPTSQS